MAVKKYTLDEFAGAFRTAAKKTTTVDNPQDFEDYILDIIAEAKKELTDGGK